MNQFEKLGAAEKKELCEVIDSGHLFYYNGKKTAAFCQKVRDYFGVAHCVPASSGTAAIHSAIGALEIPPGKEVITSPVTDMGTVIGILYQNLIPVFADIDASTGNISPATVGEKISPRTGAIIVVHLAGNPADVDGIMSVAKTHGVHVIEDCAQSYGAAIHGRKVGTHGIAGCYSLNAYKHISCGDGGFVITLDEDFHDRVANFVDKAYDRIGKSRRLAALAPCYRITELQSAVASAQMDKLDHVVSRRVALGNRFIRGIRGLDGIVPQEISPGNTCSYWFAWFRVDPAIIDRDEMATGLVFDRVPASPGYIKQPLYAEPVFLEKAFFPGGSWPAEVISGRDQRYAFGDCPVAERFLDTMVRVTIDETTADGEVDRWVKAIRELHEELAGQPES